MIALDILEYVVSLSPALSIAVSSTFTLGSASGLSMLSCFIPVKNRSLVSATECLHPASIDVFVMMVLLQNPSHCMILGAICCCIVKARSTIGKLCSMAFSISISRSIVSKNFSKS